ncbi:MAG: LysR substrate-binding domain-containing protein [Phenylobacterium sp.]|uniref:LysR family transcriptional regulator n=1 Tax=Phenylobacterium sp. TaxID=1871053 RepID=UPI00391D9168
MRGLNLDLLDAFAAVARRRSFRAAAAERGVSPSTLSQSVRDLEARMGVRLLNRTTRSVAPTEAGMRLLERLSPAFAEIASAVDQAQAAQGEPAGLLRINAPEPAVELVLAPLIARFLQHYPKVRLDVVGQTALVDIVAEGFDAGVRWDESLARDMVAVPLSGPQRYVLAASPAAIARWGAPAHPRDLLSRPCIRVKFPSGFMPPLEFERGPEVIRLEPEGPLMSSSPRLMIEAALAGAGFVCTFEGYLEAHLASGRLVRLLDEWLPPFPGPRLYYPSRRQTPPALRAFIDFVKTG